ncbi:hypothetical protein JAAARDRAFT_30423, partial [Jaapia argillacea MUCL 33604]
KGLLNSYHHLVLFFPRFLAGQESEFDVVELATKSTASRRHAAQSHWTTPRLDHLVPPRLQAVTAHLADHRDHPVTLKARVGHPTRHSTPPSTLSSTNLKRGSSSVESRANTPWPKMRHD